MSQFSLRRFLILLVSVLGGLALLLTYLPVVTVCMVFMASGCFILRAGVNGLRKGYIRINARTQCVTYDRSNNPIEFWFYVFLSIMMGLLAFGCALFFILKRLKVLA